MKRVSTDDISDMHRYAPISPVFVIFDLFSFQSCQSIAPNSMPDCISIPSAGDCSLTDEVCIAEQLLGRFDILQAMTSYVAAKSRDIYNLSMKFLEIPQAEPD